MSSPPRTRVKILGAVPLDLVGATIKVLRDGKQVGAARVTAAGAYATTVPAPPANRSARARYQVVAGTDRSSALKLNRRFIVDTLTVRAGKVTVTGRLIGPLPKPLPRITFRRATSCTSYVDAGQTTPDRKGRFTITLKAPAGSKAGIYRGTALVARPHGKPVRTFSLPPARSTSADRRPGEHLPGRRGLLTLGSVPAGSISSFFDAVGEFAARFTEVDFFALLVGLLCFGVYLTGRSRAYFHVLRAAYPAETFEWRRIRGAYISAYGFNNVVPARGGDVIELFLTKNTVPNSSYPAVGVEPSWSRTCSTCAWRSRS